MTVKIKMIGDVVDDDTAEVYEWLGMDSINPHSIAEQLTEADGDDIELDISSPGGDVFAASDIYSAIQNYSGKTTALITGIAASAASVIAMSADTLRMAQTAQLMIHRASTLSEGNIHDVQKDLGMLKSIDDSIASTYAVKTGKSKDDILALMDAETWLSADMAVEQGFANEIDQRTPQFVNSKHTIISKDIVNKFKEMKLSQPSDNYKAKLAILLPKEGA